MDLREWMSDAMCRRITNDFWYPPEESKQPELYHAIGRELCHRCPVWKNCLDSGKNEPYGMWGGLTTQERTVLHNSNPKPTHVRAHGSWLRYRQGCRCSDCVDAHNQPTNSINTRVLPKWREPVGDLEMLRFNLLSDPNAVN